MMLGVQAAVKRWNLERGLRRGREEGLAEGREEGLAEGRDEMVRMFRKWLTEERVKGSEGFREDPPFLNNEQQD